MLSMFRKRQRASTSGARKKQVVGGVQEGCRVLFVTPIVPVPCNRGNRQRTDQTIRALLAIGAAVHILVLNGGERKVPSKVIEARIKVAYPSCEVSVIAHPEVFATSKVISRRIRYWRYRLELLLDRLTLRALTIGNRQECPGVLGRKIRRLLNSGAYDIYFSNYATVTPLTGIRFRGRTVCDTHDLQARRKAIELNLDASSSISTRIRYHVFAWSEAFLLQKFDSVMAISSVEAAAMEKIVGKKGTVFYVPASTFSPEPRAAKNESSTDLLYVGSASKFNVDALLWFLTEIFPAIVADEPGVRLAVAGGASSQKTIIKAASRFRDNIVLMGFVGSLQEAYAEAKVVICPLRHGTGMKIKVVEALSMSSAIIGTPVAFESIAIEHGNSAIVAETAQQFLSGTRMLLADAELRKRLAAGAQALYARDHSFAAHVESVASIVGL